MRSKKWILILPLSILAIVIVGCAGEEVTINDTYAITVCQKTDNAVVSAEGIEYETGPECHQRKDPQTRKSVRSFHDSLHTR